MTNDSVIVDESEKLSTSKITGILFVFLVPTTLAQRVIGSMMLKGVGSVARGFDIRQTGDSNLMKRLMVREGVTLGITGASTLGLEMAFHTAKPFLKSLPIWQNNKTWLKLLPMAGAYISAEALGRKFSGFGNALKELSNKATQPAKQVLNKASKQLGFTGQMISQNNEINLVSMMNYQQSPYQYTGGNFSQFA